MKNLNITKKNRNVSPESSLSSAFVPDTTRLLSLSGSGGREEAEAGAPGEVVDAAARARVRAIN